MSGFSLEWLNLREAADLQARDRGLLQAAMQWLQTMDTPIIVDLGSGSGSTLRALEQAGLHKALWRLVDNDGKLLDAALQRHLGKWMLEDYQADLSIVNELPLGGAALVTASALFDLASEQFMEQLARRLPEGCALYSALNYNGVMSWSAQHPFDAQVVSAFNRDQQRNKGMGGPALGPQAVAFLRTLLEGSGFSVEVAESPWKIEGQSQRQLLLALVEGIAEAVSNTLPAEEVAEWHRFRQQHVDNDSCYVGHLDLLALPAEIA